MAATLLTPITHSTTATTVQITSVINSIEESRFEIRYIVLLDDNTPFKRGSVVISGYDGVKALYAEQDAAMAEGKSFEEASTMILYDKVLAAI